MMIKRVMTMAAVLLVGLQAAPSASLVRAQTAETQSVRLGSGTRCGHSRTRQAQGAAGERAGSGPRSDCRTGRA